MLVIAYSIIPRIIFWCFIILGKVRYKGKSRYGKNVIERLKSSHKRFYFALIGEDREARRFSRRRFRYSEDKLTNLPRKSTQVLPTER